MPDFEPRTHFATLLSFALSSPPSNHRNIEHGESLAADAARIAKEGKREEQKHTSRGVFVAVEGGLRTVVDKEEGAVSSIHGEAWVMSVVVCWLLVFTYETLKVGRHGMKTSRKLYVVRQARTTKYLWSMARDASIEPGVLKNGLLFKEA